MTDQNQDYELLDALDSPTPLAGSNKFEILLFSLGTRETFALNVYKIKEICRTPPVTRTPNMPASVEGVISLRGDIIPVISLARFLEPARDAAPGGFLIVTEYNKKTVGFLVDAVERMERVDWEKVRPTEGQLADDDPVIMAVTRLEDGRLVSILHVEKILTDLTGKPEIPDLAPLPLPPEAFVFLVDDSVVSRREVAAVLDRMTVRYQQATNGEEAWQRLQSLAARAKQTGRALKDTLRLILTDAEMPLMDGYVLTHNVKADARFAGIPVIMHSSLSSEANRDMGRRVGCDDYVAKFDPQALADKLRQWLR